MGNWLNQSALWAHQQLLAVAGVAIVYKAPGKLPVTVTAIRSQQQTAVDGFEQLNTTDERWDWIFEARHLPFLPAKGHRIEDGQRMYQVLPLEGERAYAWSDHGHQLVRVHTKLVKG